MPRLTAKTSNSLTPKLKHPNLAAAILKVVNCRNTHLCRKLAETLHSFQDSK